MTRERFDYVKTSERRQRILRRRNTLLSIAMFAIVAAVLFL